MKGLIILAKTVFNEVEDFDVDFDFDDLVADVFGKSGLIRKVQKKINQIMLDFLFVPDSIRSSWVPNSTLTYERQEVTYTNDLTMF